VVGGELPARLFCADALWFLEALGCLCGLNFGLDKSALSRVGFRHLICTPSSHCQWHTPYVWHVCTYQGQVDCCSSCHSIDPHAAAAVLCCVVLLCVLLCYGASVHAIGSLQTCAGFTNPSESQDCLCIMPSGATLVGSTMRARHIACERSNMFACVLGSLRLIAGVSQTSAVMTLCRVCQAS
jgi:hypothetical protein